MISSGQIKSIFKEFFDDAKLFIEDLVKKYQGNVHRIPIRRCVRILFENGSVITVYTSFDLHVFYNKDYLFIQNDKFNRTRVYPMHTIACFTEMPFDDKYNLDDIL